MSKIHGEELMLFLSGASIAYATNHTLTLNGDTTDTSNKDEGSGGWASSEVSQLSWTCTSDNLYCDEGSGKTYADLFTLMVAKTPITCVFAQKKSAAIGADGWTAGSGWTGQGVITSLELQAQNGEYATYSVTINGVGALTATA